MVGAGGTGPSGRKVGNDGVSRGGGGGVKGERGISRWQREGTEDMVYTVAH